MNERPILHVTSGDSAGHLLEKAGLPGEVLIWHDLLYEGPRVAGWPNALELRERAAFLVEYSGGSLKELSVLQTLNEQYERLRHAASTHQLVFWFDACLFDQSMLVHILNCLEPFGVEDMDLLCVDAYPGISPYHGLGQLSSKQLHDLYPQRRPLAADAFAYARRVDEAIASKEQQTLEELAKEHEAPLPWVPAAIARWLQEQPHPDSGLGRLETLTLDALQQGEATPLELFRQVASADTPPQYWGDITLWRLINGLAERQPPLVEIDGPHSRLPQWQSDLRLEDFRIKRLIPEADLAAAGS